MGFVGDNEHATVDIHIGRAMHIIGANRAPAHIESARRQTGIGFADTDTLRIEVAKQINLAVLNGDTPGSFPKPWVGHRDRMADVGSTVAYCRQCST